MVAAAARPFIGRPASRANLQALVAAMTAAYGRSPIALFTIVIPQQDLTTGTVTVRVGEGHVEAVLITGEVENRHLGLVRAYADHYGLDIDDEALNARAIEWSATRGARSGRVAIQLVRTLAGELGKTI